jgi:hypothetical protein
VYISCSELLQRLGSADLFVRDLGAEIGFSGPGHATFCAAGSVQRLGSADPRELLRRRLVQRVASAEPLARDLGAGSLGECVQRTVS